MILVIQGPQGCGKTTHAAALAQHFGFEQVVDDWNGADPLPDGALVLTAGVDVLPAGGRVTVLAFDLAMAQAGLLSAA